MNSQRQSMNMVWKSVLKSGFVLKLHNDIKDIAKNNGFPIYSYVLNNKGGNPYEQDHNRPAPYI